MASFPILSTGAPLQYPFVQRRRYVTQVVQFLDGSEQRFKMRLRAELQWQMKYSLLAETETRPQEDFVRELRGSGTAFSFPDPYSGVNESSCRLTNSNHMEIHEDNNHASTTVSVTQEP